MTFLRASGRDCVRQIRGAAHHGAGRRRRLVLDELERRCLLSNASAITVQPESIAATEGKSFSGLVATFTDSDGNTKSSAYTATITWGDGSKGTGTVVVDPKVKARFDVTASHTFAEKLAKGTVTVQIKDTDGGSAPVRDPLKVVDAALTATGTTLVDQSLHNLTNVVVATFTDADPKGTVRDYSATINWGDTNAVTTGKVVADPKIANQFDVVGSHQFAVSHFSTATVGFTVATTIREAGGSSATAKSSIVVAQARLISAKEGATIGGTPNTKPLTVAAFDSSNPKIDLTKYSVMVSWSDGTTSVGKIKANAAVKFEYDVTAGRNAFEEEGKYLVVTHITGPNGLKLNIAGVVNVSDAALANNNATAPTFTQELGTAFDGRVGDFVDMDPHGVTSDYSGTIDWGDGSPIDTATFAPGGGSSVLGPTFSVVGDHMYTAAGQYKVTASVQDAGGKTVTLTATVTVEATVTVLPPAATEGMPLKNVQVATFAAGTDANASQFSALIDWGDGQQSSGTIQALGPGQFVVLGTHTYDEESPDQKSPPGQHFNLQVQVLGLDLNKPVAGHASLTVQDAALVLQGAAPTITSLSGKPLTAVTVATFTDQDPQGTASDYTATIDWGDGKTSPGTIQPIAGNGSGSPPSFNVLGDHTYSNPGRFAIVVTIKDDGGATLVVNATVTGSPAVLQMMKSDFLTVEIAGQPLPYVPDNALFLFTPAGGQIATAYNFDINWGDGTPDTTNPPFFNNPAPFPPMVSIFRSHVYADGGPNGPFGYPLYYTITVTITGPGITTPLTGTVIQPVQSPV